MKNTYITLDEFHEMTSNVHKDKLDINDLERASLLLDGFFNWIENKKEVDQILEFPRSGQDEVPIQIRQATVFVAEGLIFIRKRLGIKNERVGKLSVTYSDLDQSSLVKGLVKPFIKTIEYFDFY